MNEHGGTLWPTESPTACYSKSSIACYSKSRRPPLCPMLTIYHKQKTKPLQQSNHLSDSTEPVNSFGRTQVGNIGANYTQSSSDPTDPGFLNKGSRSYESDLTGSPA